MYELIFYWLLLILAGLFFARLLNDIRKLKAIDNWTNTLGELSYCQLIEDGHQLKLNVRYEYLVSDQVYSSDVIHSPYDSSPVFSKKVRLFYYRLLRSFESHESVKVYYNPKEPGESVLYRQSLRRVYGYTLFFLLLIIAHISYMVFIYI